MKDELIEEGIIPNNFSWRAGIGKETPDTHIPNSNTKGFDPFSNNFVPNDSYAVKHQPNPANAETLKFNQTLLYDMDTNLTDIIDRHKMTLKDKDAEYQMLRNKMREYFTKVHARYESMLGPDFYKLLYNTCLRQYTSEWIMKCGEAGVENINGQEYVIVDKKFVINPFVVYSMFSGDSVQVNNIYEGPLNS